MIEENSRHYLQFADVIRCPRCRGHLRPHNGEELACEACSSRFPIVSGIPVLINDDNSLFSTKSFVRGQDTFFDSSMDTRFRRLYRRLRPDTGANIRGRRNYGRFADLLLERSESPRVLVLGGSILGFGMDALVSHRSIRTIDTDVSFGPRTALVCDAHDIPFADCSVDGVVGTGCSRTCG